MSRALKLALSPLLAAQAIATRRRALVMPEAAGPREGWLGERGERALRLLIAGDSSAAGVGVAHQDAALAGQLLHELHRLTGRGLRWALHARSGLTTAQVHELLRAAPPPPADIAVIVTGVNDVVSQVPVLRAVEHRSALADWLLKEHGVSHVVFAPLPPVHQFPLLPQPLRYIAGSEARRHDEAMARWAASRSDVSHVPIDVVLSVQTMALDGFHPGEPVYRTCGHTIAAHIAALLRQQKETTS